MPHRTIDQNEATNLLARPDVLVLDVRTPEEHTHLGHIPGSRLLPVQCIASAPAVVPRDGRPVLVYCEHGVRSRHAVEVLTRSGFANVHDLAHGMADWTGPREFGEGALWGPSRWVLEQAAHYTGRRRVLDVASGRGRHALLFAASGFSVTAVDRDAAALDELTASAHALGVAVGVRAEDMEVDGYTFGADRWDIVVVTRYLHRPLFPALRAALAPGGVLVYETFTAAQRDEPTGPSCQDVLLQPGELVRLVSPLEVLEHYEGVRDGQHLAGVVARRRAVAGA